MKTTSYTNTNVRATEPRDRQEQPVSVLFCFDPLLLGPCVGYRSDLGTANQISG